MSVGFDLIYYMRLDDATGVGLIAIRPTAPTHEQTKKNAENKAKI